MLIKSCEQEVSSRSWALVRILDPKVGDKAYEDLEIISGNLIQNNKLLFLLIPPIRRKYNVWQDLQLLEAAYSIPRNTTMFHME